MSRDLQALLYRGWHIYYDPPPIPTRSCDWQFYHDDFDGAPDAGDNRCGFAPTLDAAKAEIDEREFDACGCSAADPLECMALQCAHRDAALIAKDSDHE